MTRISTGAALLAGAAMIAATAPAAATQYAVHINLVNDGTVAAGSNAEKGFTAAAKYWESVLTTSQPTVVNIQIGFKPLGPNILGSTGSSFTSKAIVNVANRITARQSTAFDSTLKLPTLRPGYFGVASGDAVDVYTPGYTGCCDVAGNPYGIDNSVKVYDTDNSYNNSVIGLTTANAKAIGYSSTGSGIDARISFSSQFAFDFNPRNGIAAGSYDFYAVAIHEFGHALGFVSGVDDYDFLGGPNGPAKDSDCSGDGSFTCGDYPANNDWFGETLDLFRYSADGKLDWTTNTASYFSADGGASAFEGGLFSTGTYHGDGWQASHWKAPQLPSGAFSCALPKLGIMNPYICNGRNGIVTGLDLAALDAIGWNTSQDVNTYGISTAQIAFLSTNVPEPASWAMLIAGFGLTGAAMRRRKAVVGA